MGERSGTNIWDTSATRHPGFQSVIMINDMLLKKLHPASKVTGIANIVFCLPAMRYFPLQYMYAAWYPRIFPRSMCFVVVLPNIFFLEITDDKEGSISPVSAL